MNKRILIIAVIGLVISGTGLVVAARKASVSHANTFATQTPTPLPTASISPSPTPNEAPSPTPQPTQTSIKEPVRANVGIATATPRPERSDYQQPPSREEECARSTIEAAEAGWRILSCDPLKVEPINKPEVETATPVDSRKYEKSNYSDSFKAQDPHYQWDEVHQCYDESNFPGQFAQVEPVTFPDPNWLEEVKQDDGCSFFFHPTQGMENSPITDGRE